MMWFFAVLVVLALGAVAVVAAGGGDSLAREYDDRPEVSLPEGRALTGDDLREIRFSTAVRGYRASEVDALLERLARELDLRSEGPDTAH
ncbi:MAG TPA: DivIVA domain-containing protein [Marmoricola sp.]|nr:DivIVA domain-containing protein [Marmoricola sp.]